MWLLIFLGSAGAPQVEEQDLARGGCVGSLPTSTSVTASEEAAVSTRACGGSAAISGVNYTILVRGIYERSHQRWAPAVTAFPYSAKSDNRAVPNVYRRQHILKVDACGFNLNLALLAWSKAGPHQPL